MVFFIVCLRFQKPARALSFADRKTAISPSVQKQIFTFTCHTLHNIVRYAGTRTTAWLMIIKTHCLVPQHLGININGINTPYTYVFKEKKTTTKNNRNTT